MKKILFTFFLIFISSLIIESEAQVVNSYIQRKANQATRRAGQKADQEITKEMNKKVDEAVENAFDKALNGDDDEKSTESDTTKATENTSRSSADRSDARSKAMMSKMGISMERPENVKNTYDFSGNIVMLIKSWDEDGNADGEQNYTTYITKDNSGFAMQFDQEDGRSTMIFDYEGQLMIILTEDNDDKTGMVTQYTGISDTTGSGDNYEPDEETKDFSSYNPNLKKTGKSKKIAGYTCDEYTFEDETAKGEMWLTDDLPSNIWSNMSGANIFNASATGYYGGFVMEMDQKSIETNERTFMQVQEVNQKQEHSISTTEYNLMSFSVATPEEETAPENEEAPVE